jgi:putative MFS transporter
MPYQAVESPSVQQDAFPPVPPHKFGHNVEQRLDALEPRLSWFYVRLLLLVGVSWAIQAAELALLVFTRLLVANDIGMGTPVLEIFGASIFMGAMAGGPLFGHVADAFGRRIALLAAMVFSLGGLAVSARANVEYVLIIGRVVVGLGLGGQLSSTVVLVQELAPSSMRGRVLALLDAFAGVGGLIGLALAYAVAPSLEWRTTYLATCGLVLYALVLRFAVPESPRWLASVGQVDEPLALVELIERSHGHRSPSGGAPKEGSFTEIPASPSSTLEKSSWTQRMVPTLVLWLLWVATTLSSYALGIYVPTLISLNGYNVFASWITIGVLYIAQVLGSLTAALVLDSHGPQKSLAGFAASATVSSVVLSYVPCLSALVVASAFLVTASLAGCWSCVLTYTQGCFTTLRRGRGMGYAVGVSRVAAVGGSYLFPHMFNVWIVSVPALCWVFGGLLTGVAVVVVPYFGLQSLDQHEDSHSYAWASETDVEPGLLKSADSEEQSTGSSSDGTSRSPSRR